jgi:hypothetical protein
MATEETINTYRRSAIIVGVLYIIGTVAGVLSVVFIGPILSDPGVLTDSSTNANRLIIAALFVLTMGLALAMVPVVMYPISKKFNEVLALGFVLFRGALETFAYMATVIGWLFLLSISQAVILADVSNFQAVSTVVLDATGIGSITTIVFLLGALMFYYVLYRWKLVPRWLSGWGLIATLPYLIAGLLVLFGRLESMSTFDAVLRLPLGIQEMVLAVWLIAKGFNSSAFAPESS